MYCLKNLLLFCLLLAGYYVQAQKSTYVIVHGAWGGAWQFKNTAAKLEENDSVQVYRANLTGLGERYHLAGPNVNLSTHINDVINMILFERLDNIILVGHSYGGMVITGVADSIPNKIKKLVYLDAMLPEDQESVQLIMNRNGSDAVMKNRDENYIYPSWVKDTTVFPRDVPHPIASMQQKISLHNPDRLNIPSTYILTYEPALGDKTKDAFYPFAQRAINKGWKIVELEADHNPQIKKLDELVKLLINEK